MNGQSAASRLSTTADGRARHPLTDALTMLDSRDERRLVVLDPDGDRPCGLLCLTSDRRGLCPS